MHEIQRAQTRDLLKARGIDCALFAQSNSVTWLTGFAMPVQTGPNFFAGAGALVWYAGGRFTLVVLDAWAEAAAPFAREPDGAVAAYLGYTIAQPTDGLRYLLEVLQPLWRKARGSIGIERADLTAAVYDALRSAAPQATLSDIDGWLKPLRMVKTDEELVKLRENFRLTDIAQRAASGAVRAGQREIDVWDAAHGAVQQAAGCRVPMGNDCVVGYRQANIGGWPLDFSLHENDSLIVDLSTIRYGYWSDSCDTFYAGNPTPKQKELRAIAAEALTLGDHCCAPVRLPETLTARCASLWPRQARPSTRTIAGMGWGYRATKRRASCHTMKRPWQPAWLSCWSRAFTCRARPACGWRTPI